MKTGRFSLVMPPPLNTGGTLLGALNTPGCMD